MACLLYTSSVTHAAGSALTKEADYTIVHGFEANYAAKLEKMGYVLALAVEILQQVEGFDKYDKMIAVSYTHLDVYKRQTQGHSHSSSSSSSSSSRQSSFLFFQSLMQSLPILP